MADRRSLHLFWTAWLCLFTAGISASLRAADADAIKAEYLDPIDPSTAAARIAGALGAAFLGFALTLLLTSIVLTRIPAKATLQLAGFGFLAGTALVMCCGVAGPAHAASLVWAGMFLCGIGWGATEGTVNPLVATSFPNDSAARLNMLHAYWPAGLIVGGLLGTSAGAGGIGWRVSMGLVLALACAICVVVSLQTIPSVTPPGTERLAPRDRFMALARQPSIFLWSGLMLLTSSSELAPGQWVDVALSHVVGMRGILLLVYVSMLMFVGRHFAGPIVHRIRPEGLLCGGSLLAFIGLLGLSIAHSPPVAIFAATLWGLGVCFLWPTMISIAATRYRDGGSISIGLLGTAGALSSYYLLPALGRIYDHAALQSAGGPEALMRLTGDALRAVQMQAAFQSFRAIAVAPAILVVAFAVLWALANRREART